MQNSQELLNKLLKQQLSELKKKCFKYKHNTPFILRDLTIESGDLSELKASGIYKKLDGKHKFDFTHKIVIDDGVIDQYLNFNPNLYWFNKWDYKNQIKDVIKHELVHAFVREHYSGLFNISGISNDASPIFLSVLYWLGGSSNHNCVKAFKRTELYHKLKEFESFQELDNHLTQLLLDYDRIANKHKDGIMMGKVLVTNSFMIGARNAGINNYCQYRLSVISDIKSETKALETNLFEIGCCTMPEDIDALISKKRFGKFEKYEYSKVAVNTEKNTVKTVYKVASGM